MSREWITGEITHLELELKAAEVRADDSRVRLNRAKAEHREAMAAVETLVSVIFGLREELAIAGGQDERPVTR
jgi:hypothetical protein